MQSYLIQQFGPSTTWQTPTTTNSNSNSNSAATTQASSSAQTSDSSEGTSAPTNLVTSIVTVSIGSIGIPIAMPSSSSPADSPTANTSGLSRDQKIGIGVGVPLAILGAAALLLGCCFFLRRRHKKSVDGSQPPSSPGFIPRFAFQEKGEHHTPLNRHSGGKHLSQDTGYSNYSNWDDDVIETMENTQRANAGMKTHQAPIPAPPLYHTHSSNRARGKRTSYSSLHSVAEVHEPDESPVLPRESLLRQSPPRRQSFGLVPGAAQLKRKPVPSASANTSPRSSLNTNGDRHSLAAAAAAASASQTLLRQPMPDHSNSSSTNSTNSTLSPGSGNHHLHTTPSPVSPLSDAPRPSKFNNPFSNDYQYVEDYGPEYMNVFHYDDLENGLYGGHTDLSQYPDPPAKNASRTEWPLRNAMGHRRNKSPLWDRVYEG